MSQAYSNDDCSRGPVSTMPGHVCVAADGAKCMDHDDRAATHRVQGETDSFGCEYLHFCAECFDKYKAEVAAAREQEANTERRCDWCAKMAKGVRLARDYDEGSAGPLYDVCPACLVRQSIAAEEEMEAMEANDPYHDDWSD